MISPIGSRRGLIAILILASRLACQTGFAQPTVAQGQVIFQTDFEAPDTLSHWQGSANLETGYQSARSVALVQKESGASHSSMIHWSLPAEPLRGCLIYASAMIKAEQVSDKPNPWNGIKFMLAIESPAGKAWPQADQETGTFAWRQAAFTARIPRDARQISLCLGLENVAGNVWFDDVKVTVAKPPFIPKPMAVPGHRFTGHSMPRLRGAMVSPNLDEAGLQVLGRDWNANLIRWQLIRHERPGQPLSLADYDRWLEGELQRIDTLLPACEKFGVYVAIDLHSPPGGKPTNGGYVGSDARLFTDRACQDKLVEVWRRIATRYRTAKAVWGYDLANEPVEERVEEGCDDWQGLAERTAPQFGPSILSEPSLSKPRLGVVRTV